MYIHSKYIYIQIKKKTNDYIWIFLTNSKITRMSLFNEKAGSTRPYFGTSYWLPHRV